MRRFPLHGMKGTRLHRIWRAMLNRCYYPKSDNYHRYGGRGITVCDEWRQAFRPFMDWALTNGYRDDLQIDRKENDGNYEPENCKWSTPREQSTNRASTRFHPFSGELLSIAEIERRCGFRKYCLAQRLTTAGVPHDVEIPMRLLDPKFLRPIPKYINQQAA